MDKISVVVPVYNVEDYLSKCLDSILSQTFQNIEVICVNDGSTDGSLNILEHYQKFDDRIKIVNKNNGGLSSARNAGFECAVGEYVMFVDSDDCISSVAVEKLYESAKEYMADVVVFDYIEGDNGYNKCQYKTMPNYKDKYKAQIFNAITLPDDSYKYFAVTAWTKLYRTKFMKDNNIKFCEGLYYEDVPFWAKVFCSAKNIIYLPEPFYFYNQGNADSIMRKNDERFFDVFRVYQLVFETFKKNNLYEKYKHTINLVAILNFLQKFEKIQPNLREEFFQKMKSFKVDADFKYYESGEFLDFEINAVRQFSTLETADYNIFCRIMGVQNDVQ